MSRASFSRLGSTPPSPSSPATRDRVRATAGVGGVSSAFLIVSIILLAILLGWIPMSGTPPTPNVTVNCTNGGMIEDSTTCSQTTACLQGYLTNNNGSCEYLAAPTTQACNDSCFAQGGGMCDAAGHCRGNASACTGMCADSNYCLNLNAVNGDIQEYFDPVTLWTWSSWYDPFTCYYGSCIWLIFDIEITSSTFPLFNAATPVPYNFSIGGARTLCQDYFETGFVQNYSNCLSFERVMLSSALINYTNFVGNYGNSSYPFQIGVCIASFTCSFAAPPDKKKRAMEQEPPFKTRDQWGILPVSETHPGTGMLGIKDPMEQNRFYAFLHDTYVTAAPLYLPTFLTLNGYTQTPAGWSQPSSPPPSSTKRVIAAHAKGVPVS